MSSLNKQRLLENVIYVTLWLLIFCVPFLDSRLSGEASLKWENVYMSWKTITPFFLLFLLNNYVAIPLFFSTRKYLAYFFSVILMILVIFTLYPQIFYKTSKPKSPPAPIEQSNHERLTRHDDPPPDEKFPKKERPFSPGEREFSQPHYRPLFNPRSLDSLFTNFLVGILLVGFNLAIRLFIKSIKDQQSLKELEKHNLQFELEYLKGQINPHFFMNMLNNIHALVDIDSELAKETIIGFSKLMRYVLYDASQKTIGLDKEVAFIRNYVELMKIRYTQDVDIRLSLPAIVPDLQIPPLLFISFIENAFKHGISYRNRSFVVLSLETDESLLTYKVINSRWTKQTESPEDGIGLVNVRKRLDLIYGDCYQLTTTQTESEYSVLLIIPLKLIR